MGSRLERGRTGELGRAYRVAASQRHDLTARIGAERGDEHHPPVIAADNADAEHDYVTSRRNGGPGSGLALAAMLIFSPPVPTLLPADTTPDARTGANLEGPYKPAEMR